MLVQNNQVLDSIGLHTRLTESQLKDHNTAKMSHQGPLDSYKVASSIYPIRLNQKIVSWFFSGINKILREYTGFLLGDFWTSTNCNFNHWSITANTSTSASKMLMITSLGIDIFCLQSERTTIYFTKVFCCH
uniref:Uncharacterized protein n=1 Tax=Rhizophora mucronata TaxID=61149 RepID=A0A2P2IUY8_RHIMU